MPEDWEGGGGLIEMEATWNVKTTLYLILYGAEAFAPDGKT